MAQGELMRFLAEAPWYPTVLLPGSHLRWEPVDDRTARVTLRDGMRVPLVGEVAWRLPEGLRPYWRGRVTRLVHVFGD